MTDWGFLINDQKYKLVSKTGRLVGLGFHHWDIFADQAV